MRLTRRYLVGHSVWRTPFFPKLKIACVASAWKWWAQGKTGAREGDTRGDTLRVSPSRAPVFSFAHYFQAPATQAKIKDGVLLGGSNLLLWEWYPVVWPFKKNVSTATLFFNCFFFSAFNFTQWYLKILSGFDLISTLSSYLSSTLNVLS